jgi:DnaJ like chaperone protein
VNIIDLLVIVAGLCLGYWLVSRLIFEPPPKEQPKPEAPLNAPTRPTWYDILLVSPAATTAEIRDAYRRLISQYHPDKVSNAAPEIQDLAKRKSQEITTAYSEAMRERGEQG